LLQHLQKHWVLGEEHLVQHTDEFTLVMAQTQQNCSISGAEQMEVVEGNKKDNASVGLVEDGQFRYCILRGLAHHIVFSKAI